MAEPPPESLPHELEVRRDEVLLRLARLRARTTSEKQRMEVTRLNNLTQRMKNGFELAHLEMALDYLELIVDLGGSPDPSDSYPPR